MNELQEQYRLLDVPADVSLETLKQAYKDLVLVWHPDRFSHHPRLQKKAEEKLKCINLAYQTLRKLHRGEQFSSHSAPSATDAATPPPNNNQGPHHNQRRHHTYQQSQTYKHGQTKTGQTKTGQTKPCASEISFSQARFILSHFQFRGVQRSNCDRQYFKSGPFNLEINDQTHQILLENLCDSINGFHPILLRIPCKASQVFSGSEARHLIALFQASQKE